MSRKVPLFGVVPVVIVVILVAVLALQPGAAGRQQPLIASPATPPVTATRTMDVSQSLCASLLKGLQQHAVGDAQLPTSSAGCTANVTTRTTLLSFTKTSTSSSGWLWCVNIYWRMDLYGWGYFWAQPNTNVRLCGNGSHVWQSGWGPDCYVRTAPGYSPSISWCGVYNNGGSFVEPGSNFSVTILRYAYTWYGYFRFHVNASGPDVTATWGGLG